MRRGNHYKIERRIAYLVSFTFIIFLFLIWLFLPPFFFPLEKISIIGGSHFSEGEVLTLLSRLKGKSLSYITMKELSSSLSKISWIGKFDAYKLPPHTLLLKIKERKPFLLVYYDKKIPLLVDEEGYLLESSPQGYSLPTLYVSKIKMGKNNRLPPKLISQIKEILDELKGTPISVEKIYLSQNEDIQIMTQKGLKIIIGRPKELYQKLFLLKTLWGRIPNIEDRLLNINLSCLQAPAIMEKRENK
jgi:cell division septal protein FtsQ